MFKYVEYCAMYIGTMFLAKSCCGLGFLCSFEDLACYSCTEGKNPEEVNEGKDDHSAEFFVL